MSSLPGPPEEVLIIYGGQPLRGTVRVSGAKNAALPLMAASILFDKPFVVHNVPDLGDVKTMMELLRVLGIRAEKNNTILTLVPGNNGAAEAPYELVKKMRASILVLGPLTARRGTAVVALPGGCSIGTRPVDLHIKGLQALGATISLEKGNIIARARRLKGAHIVLDFATVTGTENLVMAAVLAEGETVIENAAREPEVVELCEFLRACGAIIEGIGTDILHIKGVNTLSPPSEWHLMPDRIEAGTLLVAGALAGEPLRVEGLVPEHLSAVLDKLRTAGVELELGDKTITVWRSSQPRPASIKTAPYPGFPTDMQAQFAVLLSLADGESIIHETIFENRFQYVPELVRMGAQIDVEGTTAFIKGVKRLTGAPVTATDLRASASLVLAGLVAEGESVIYEVGHLDRGYEKLENKLQSVGARIERKIKSE